MISTVNPTMPQSVMFADYVPNVRNESKAMIEFVEDVTSLQARFDGLGWKRVYMSDVARFGAGVEIGLIRVVSVQSGGKSVSAAMPVLGYVTDFVRVQTRPSTIYRVAVDGGDYGTYGPDWVVWMKM